MNLNLCFKTATGRRVPLTDLLGQIAPAKAQQPPAKTTDKKGGKKVLPTTLHCSQGRLAT
ncbi:MAG: hypothetical protein PHH59_16785 [Methylovulum sp.]|uniref:hypothetical protein n=1 Tax=Methylovulum sp. TaxID=1916980 RepID=UPI00262E5274|nr:hypothetical protein [Methylovulum sp.]MDD2725656.1 hypothetical protein [Methylovulum sp.]